MVNETPLVTAVIPVWNCERYLAEAIDSVLAQDYPAVDLLVVDDGSTDNSAAIAKSYGGSLRYLYQENTGLAGAQNTGYREARGEFVAYLDSDDLWLPGKISRQMDVFRETPELDIVFAHVEQFHSPDIPDLLDQQPPPAMAGIHTGCMLARRDVFERVGPFDTEITLGEFLDWYARAQDAGIKVRVLDDIMLRRRIHDRNMGLQEKNKRADYLRVFKASLDRRRKLQQQGD